MNPVLRYIQGYPEHIVTPVTQMVESGRLQNWFKQRYPDNHTIKSEKALFEYTIAIKNRYMIGWNPKNFEKMYNSK